MEGQSEFRGRILDVLQLIADGEAQIEYQRRAPHIDIASDFLVGSVPVNEARRCEHCAALDVTPFLNASELPA